MMVLSFAARQEYGQRWFPLQLLWSRGVRAGVGETAMALAEEMTGNNPSPDVALATTATELLEQLYAREVGAQLRTVRKRGGLSLHDVAAASGREFKASTLGAYERGERTISV